MVRNNNIGVFMNEKQIDKLLDSLDSIAQSLRTFFALSPIIPRKNETSDNSPVSE